MEYLTEMYEAIQNGNRDGAAKKLSAGIKFYSEKISDATGGIPHDDLPIVVALLEKVVEVMKQTLTMSQRNATDIIKTRVSATGICVPDMTMTERP